MIPLFNMKLQHAPLEEEILGALRKIVESAEFAGGGMVERFESAYAAYCGVSYAVAVGNGTEALWLTLLAMGIGPGDEVITVPMTFAATVEAICLAGARPVFVDIDERTYTMDAAALDAAITPRTKAIVPVHLFGQTADMNPILKIASTHGLRVIEDAAQAHGADYHGSKAGSLGDAGCFSFYPAKNLGACGEGGAVVTQDAELAERLRILRNHGQLEKNRHEAIGWNSRMDAFQAAVLNVKLPHLDRWNQLRRQHARQYGRAFSANAEWILPAEANDRRHVYHIYAVRVRERMNVMRWLATCGIECGIHYPTPLHLQPAYAFLGRKLGDFPVAERCATEFVSLPIYPELTSEQIEWIADAFHEAVAKRRSA
jgi:dTDP-4-amino-4,6-dideoxygalactose transaminase